MPKLRATTAGAVPRRGLRGAPALACALASALALAGCAGSGPGRSGVVYYTNFTAGYVPASVAAASPLLVETFGSPAAASAPDLTQAAVTDATVGGLRRYGPPWMPRNYTGSREDAPNPAYVLRIAYGVPKVFNGQQLCKTGMSNALLEEARSQADAGASRTIAGLCRGERAVAYGEGSPGANPDVSGERFAEFLGLFGRRLMPRRNPVTQDDCIFRRCD
ncbi:MAG: hypothetical protein Tsb0032_07270 [Kiloniellaceae bacterium]